MSEADENSHKVIPSKTVLEDKRRKNWFWDHNMVFDADLSTYAKLVRLLLARYADEERHAWPSLSTIARQCGISRPTAIRAIKELVRKGWLQKTVRQTASAEYRSTLYTLIDPPDSNQSTTDTGSKPEILPGKRETLPGSKPETPPGKAETPPLLTTNTTLVSEVDPKNTHLKNTKLRIPTEKLRKAMASFSDEKEAGLISPSKLSGQTSQPAEPVLKPPNSRELIAELVAALHGIPGITARKGHYPLIGRAFNQYGYAVVAAAIGDLEFELLGREKLGLPAVTEKELAQLLFARCRWNQRSVRALQEGTPPSEAGQELEYQDFDAVYEWLPDQGVALPRREG